MTLSAADQLTLSDFDFDLPESLIAQEPAVQRDQSRLLVLKRSGGNMEHRIFSEIEHYLMPGDLLVVNDTRVFPCRLFAKKPGGGKAEIFLLSEKGLNLWDALVKGGVSNGKRVRITDEIEAEVLSESEGVRTVQFHGIADIRSVLNELGKVPLPPYIKRESTRIDQERYQTVYAASEGAVAAPTAGLHFTHDLLQAHGKGC
jgi:S-adenosylmethionine:tRNA ribosyltransferase-isomerase